MQLASLTHNVVPLRPHQPNGFAMLEIGHQELLATLSYDSKTGVFLWLRRPARNMRSGLRAGSVGANGHRIIRINRIDYTAQRLAWFYVNGKWPKEKLRHNDGDRDNNRIDNLIAVNRSGKFKGEFDFSTPEGRSAYNRAHRNAHREHYQEQGLRRDFGITLDEYRTLLLVQRGVCAVCNEPETAFRNGRLKALAVDHDHDTRQVRGLLCSRCNPMLGYAKDDPSLLRAAAEYLEHWARETAAEIISIRKDAS